MKTKMGWLKLRGKTYFARWRQLIEKGEKDESDPTGKRWKRPPKYRMYTVTTGETTERAARKKLAELVAPFALASDSETARALADRADILKTAADAAAGSSR